MTHAFDEDVATRPRSNAMHGAGGDFYANRPVTGTVTASNFVGNPWALPMTREMHDQHEEGIEMLRSRNMAGSDAKRSELVRAAMPGSLSIRRSAGGEEFHSRNTRADRQGAWSSPDRLSQPDAVSQLALAWPGDVNDAGGSRPATRDEQHQHETRWAAVPGAERLESIAAPQVHPDGSILPGGGRQVWHPGGGSLGRAGRSWAESGGLGAEEIRAGTVTERRNLFERLARPS